MYLIGSLMRFAGLIALFMIFRGNRRLRLSGNESLIFFPFWIDRVGILPLWSRGLCPRSPLPSCDCSYSSSVCAWSGCISARLASRIDGGDAFVSAEGLASLFSPRNSKKKGPLRLTRGSLISADWDGLAELLRLGRLIEHG